MPTSKRKDKLSDIVLLDVSIKEKEVLLTFETEELLLSLDDYLDDYFYPGKAISKKEYSLLKEKSRQKKARLYLSSLLSQRRYTIKQVKDKLHTYSKSLKEKDIQDLLKPYIESGILDDKSYALDYIQSKKEAGYGKQYLLSELNKRGIPTSLLKDMEIEELLEEKDSADTLFLLLDKMEKQHRNETVEKRKQSLYALLLRRGFSYQEASDAVNDYYASLSEEEIENISQNRAKLLIEKAKQCYNALESRNLDERKKKDLFYQKMVRLGFHYDEIKTICEKERYYQS